MRLVGCEGILFSCAVVLSLYGWLGSNVMAADLSRQRWSLYSWPWVLSCTVYKQDECKQRNAVCKESDGKCYCQDGHELRSGTCGACTEEIERECAEIGQTCDEDIGICVCKEPGKLFGGQCKVPTCTEELEGKCAETGQTCEEDTGRCVCQEPKKMIGGECKEPACTEQKWQECAVRGATCQEPLGECVCGPGRQLIDGMCKEPRCTKLVNEICAERGAMCEESTGECVCKEGQQMIGDECREPRCTKLVKETCAERGATCEESTGECVCKDGQYMIGDECKEPRCTKQVNETCAVKGATCREPTGECVCKEGQYMIGDECKEPKCTKQMNDECMQKGAICREATGECVCKEGQFMIGGECKERACTEERIATCMAIGAICEEPTGYCNCRPGQQIVGEICKACTEEKNHTCTEKWATCQEPLGKCVCEPWKQMVNDICRACTEEKNETCAGKGATCQEPDGRCVCEPGQHLIYGTCRACTEEKNNTCAEKRATCQEPLGECSCEPGRQMIGDVCKDAALEELTWSTTLKTSQWRETTSAGTEPSKWQSGHTTEPTTARSVTSGSPSGTGECDEQVCKRPRCACASDAPPAALRVDEMPQFVMLTFDGAVNAGNMAFYRELLDTSTRKKKQNGCGIAATFFVSGEYLDYEAVNQLHSWGNEIAVKSISNRADSSYWQTINSTQWEREVLDQRTMLKAFANVPDSDVSGFRAPFLVTGGDQGFSMLHKHFRYDSTLVHQRFRGERPFYPYTMDFGFRRSCNVWPCPESSYPGLWVLPINVLFPKHSEGDLPCAMADACLPQPVTANDTFDYLKSNFDEFYTTNRAPFPVFLHEAYLHHPERKAGYLRFVDWLLEKDDVYLVTPSEVLRFMEDPKPLSSYANHTCLGKSVRGASTCQRPTTCSYKNTPPGGERYMRICSRCPKNYPWVNNPLGN